MAGRSGRVDELGREGPHPPVDRHVVDLDAALGQQFLDIAVGQAVAQIPAHRDADHLPRKPIASRRRRWPRSRDSHLTSLPTPRRTTNATVPRRAIVDYIAWFNGTRL